MIVKSRALVRQLLSDCDHHSEGEGHGDGDLGGTSKESGRDNRAPSDNSSCSTANDNSNNGSTSTANNNNDVSRRFATTPRLVDASTGVVSGGPDWLASMIIRTKATAHQREQHSAKVRGYDAANSKHKLSAFKHPLKAPLVLSPRDGKTPICRYHNYHREGCKWYIHNHGNTKCNANKNKNNSNNTNGSAPSCPFDHDHCHACLQLGHVAKDCPGIHTQQSCY